MTRDIDPSAAGQTRGSSGTQVNSEHVTGMVSRMGAGPGAQRSPGEHSSGDLHHLPVSFHGSGSEYFRIWIVNLLLTVITLGIYHPWAKARRLRYFYGNTEVGGHPLGFHAEPRRMFRGFMLVGVLTVVYSLAQEASHWAGLLAFLVLILLAPAFFKSAQQFRLANTSWRGLRMRFVGDLPGAYRAFAPLLVPSAAIVLAGVLVPDVEQPPAWFGWVMLAVLLGGAALLPLFWWSLKRYQHGHFALGTLCTELRTGPAPVYILWLKTYGLTLLTLTISAALAFGFGLLQLPTALRQGSGGVLVFIMSLLMTFAIATVLTQIVAGSFFVARQQNLLWSRTGNRSLRFKSELQFRSLLGLSLKNWLLVLITLGLYWPFAAIATARLRLEAVTLVSRVDPKELVSLARPREGEAAGDAAAELFGFDPGL